MSVEVCRPPPMLTSSVDPVDFSDFLILIDPDVLKEKPGLLGGFELS